MSSKAPFSSNLGLLLSMQGKIFFKLLPSIMASMSNLALPSIVGNSGKSSNLYIGSLYFEFFTKLINGKFPDYERVIPKDIAIRFELSRDKMVEGIKTISMLSDQMKITFSKESITFESIIEDNSEAKTMIEFQTGLEEDISINVKNRNLIDFLQSIEDEKFEFGFKDKNLPFVVSSKELLTVISPLNI